MQAAVEEILTHVVDPNTGLDLRAAKVLRRAEQVGDALTVDLEMPYPGASVFPALAAAVEAALKQGLSVEHVAVSIRHKIVAHAAQPTAQSIPGVKNVIAVASGKGGVGKSTTAVNLALALAQEGARVGMLDADIYGPSQPTMLGVAGARPESPDGKTMTPVLAHGVQTMSIGFLVEPDAAMVWRGPMVTQALLQLINETRWDDVDYLVVDLPPGTGDIQLTLSQKIPLAGAVIVTTPQDIALIDAKKGLKMFQKVNVPILGVVENMSVHICSQCGHAEPIFGEGGGERMAAQFGVELLGQMPLQLAIRLSTDGGTPIVLSDPAGVAAQTYRSIARRVAVKISQQAEDHRSKFPKITIKQD